MGDSLSAAHGIDPSKGWDSLLRDKLKQEKLPWQVINISSSGDTTNNGLEKLPAALKEYHPDVVIIALGANDGLRGLPVALIQRNLTKLVKLSQAAKAKVLLVGLLLPLNYGPVYRKQFEHVYQQVAKHFHLIFVPFLLKDIALNPKLMQEDGLHPTEEAQPLILDNLMPYLKDTISSSVYTLRQ